MDYTIRLATDNDISDLQQLNQQLCQLEHDTYDDTINPGFAHSPAGEVCFHKRIAAGGAFIVTHEACIIGYLTASIEPMEDYRFEGSLATIESIYILEEHRGKGIGTKLIEKFKEWSREQQATRMRVVVSSKNIDAIKLYKRSGFDEYDLLLEQNI